MYLCTLPAPMLFPNGFVEISLEHYPAFTLSAWIQLSLMWFSVEFSHANLELLVLVMRMLVKCRIYARLFLAKSASCNVVYTMTQCEWYVEKMTIRAHCYCKLCNRMYGRSREFTLAVHPNDERLKVEYYEERGRTHNPHIY